MTKQKDDSFNSLYRDVGPYFGLGLQLAATIVIFIFAGDWLDKKYDQGGIITIISAFLGIGIGLYNFIRTVLYLGNRKKHEDESGE